MIHEEPLSCQRHTPSASCFLILDKITIAGKWYVDIDATLVGGIMKVKENGDNSRGQVCFVHQVLRKQEEEEWRCGRADVEFPWTHLSPPSPTATSYKAMQVGKRSNRCISASHTQHRGKIEWKGRNSRIFSEETQTVEIIQHTQTVEYHWIIFSLHRAVACFLIRYIWLENYRKWL